MNYSTSEVTSFAGTTASSIGLAVMDGANHRISGATVTLTPSNGAQVFPTQLVTASDGDIVARIVAPEAPFQPFTVTVTASTGGSATVKGSSGPRILRVLGNIYSGASVSPDGRVFGRDVIGADGRLLLRSGRSVSNSLHVPEFDTSAPLFYGWDGKVYYWSTPLMVMDDKLNLLRSFDFQHAHPDHAATSGAPNCNPVAAFCGIDTAGNFYLPDGAGVIAKYAADGKFLGLYGSSAASSKQRAVLLPNGKLFLYWETNQFTAYLAELLPGAMGSLVPLTETAYGVAAGADNHIYLSGLAHISVYDANLNLISTFVVHDAAGKRVSTDAVIGADAAGNVYFGSSSNGIAKTDSLGLILWTTATTPITPLTPPPVYPNAANTSPVSVTSGDALYFRPTYSSIYQYWKLANGEFTGSITFPDPTNLRVVWHAAGELHPELVCVSHCSIRCCQRQHGRFSPV